MRKAKVETHEKTTIYHHNNPVYFGSILSGQVLNVNYSATYKFNTENMKNTLLIVSLFVGFTTFSQKKATVKNNSFTEKLRYVTLPALTEVQEYKI
jgi:hypothetical protein